MKSSPLQSIHESLGAHFDTVGDWSVPSHYGDPIAEHHAVRKTAGIADLSYRGKLLVTGDDRVTWLQSIISHDLRPLQPGQGLYSAFMSAKGKILSCFRVYIQQDAVFVEDVGEVGDTTFQAFRKFLLYGTKAKMKSCLDTWGLILVSGPQAAKVLSDTFHVEVGQLPMLSCVTLDMNLQPAFIVRTEETGEQDYEIFAPTDLIATVWEQVLTAGKPLGLQPFGTQARESLRVEAGIPKLGPDLNEQIVPPEANLEGKAFSLSKGCYPGQEVVARMDTYGSVKRRLVGLIVNARDNQVPPHGAKVFRGEREVGWVSSGVLSPTLNQVIAMAFPLRDFTVPDTELEVDYNDQRHPATVKALPFLTPTHT